MKQLKTALMVLLGLGGIVIVLWNNKAKSATMTRTDILSSFPVKVAAVTQEDVQEELSLVGTIVAHNDVVIVSETQGRVTAVTAKVGDYRKASSVLVQVDDELKEANLKAARVQYETTRKDLERYEGLYKDKSITESQYDQARLAYQSAEAQYIVARRQYNDTKITTPISGVVTARNVDVGAMVQPGMAIANVVDISKLKVKVNVPEQDVFKLNVGDAVTVTTDVYAGTAFQAHVTSIASKGDDAHTYPVELSLQNSQDHPLKAGMFCRVMFRSAPQRNTTVIPREALVGSLKKPQVYVVENGTALLKDVVISGAVKNKVAVSEGLEAGAFVVVGGQNNLQDRAPISIVE